MVHQASGEPSYYNILMKLRIFNITSNDFGTYRCLAKNSQGETSGEISLYGSSLFFSIASALQSSLVCIGWECARTVDNNILWGIFLGDHSSDLEASIGL